MTVAGKILAVEEAINANSLVVEPTQCVNIYDNLVNLITPVKKTLVNRLDAVTKYIALRLNH